MIKAVIAEDSPVARDLLVHILTSDPEIDVVGTASTGAEVVDLVARVGPDVVLMDIVMPEMNGLEATRRIMETTPVPIVIVTASWRVDEVTTTFQAMDAGALAAVPKPAGPGDEKYEEVAAKLVETVKLMSEVKVIRRTPRTRARVATPVQGRRKGRQSQGRIMVVAIGASTGGPPAVRDILSLLPKDFPAPVVVAQHIAAGFVDGLVRWLGDVTDRPVHVATDGEQMLPGHVYFAPDGHHMGVRDEGRILIEKAKAEENLRPLVSYLFRSVADTYGKDAVGVLLTGMGVDGADGLKMMRESGAVTIAQDEDTSVVHGMPGEAIRLGAATYVLPPEAIAIMLIGLASRENSL